MSYTTTIEGDPGAFVDEEIDKQPPVQVYRHDPEFQEEMKQICIKDYGWPQDKPVPEILRRISKKAYIEEFEPWHLLLFALQERLCCVVDIFALISEYKQRIYFAKDFDPFRFGVADDIDPEPQFYTVEEAANLTRKDFGYDPDKLTDDDVKVVGKIGGILCGSETNEELQQLIVPCIYARAIAFRFFRGAKKVTVWCMSPRLVKGWMWSVLRDFMKKRGFKVPKYVIDDRVKDPKPISYPSMEHMYDDYSEEDIERMSRGVCKTCGKIHLPSSESKEHTVTADEILEAATDEIMRILTEKNEPKENNQEDEPKNQEDEPKNEEVSIEKDVEKLQLEE